VIAKLKLMFALQNELDDVPFFDVSLPREIAVKIFGFLEMKDLCSCSQVSSCEFLGLAGKKIKGII